jgi:hypothetical protein
VGGSLNLSKEKHTNKRQEETMKLKLNTLNKSMVTIAAVGMLLAAALALPSKIMANDAEVKTFTVDVAFGLPYFQNNIDPAETAQNPKMAIYIRKVQSRTGRPILIRIPPELSANTERVEHGRPI